MAREAMSARGRAVASVRAKVLTGAGWLISLQGDYERAEELCKESLALYRELGNRQGIALALQR